MTAEDLIELLEERPFVPQRLRLDDGSSHENRHPEMAIASPTLIFLGLPRKKGSKMVERVTYCSIPYIVEVEPIGLAKK